MHKVFLPTLNIWQAQIRFNISYQKKITLIVNRGQFLFLVEIRKDDFLFKTEDGVLIKINRKAIEFGHVKKVF